MDPAAAHAIPLSVDPPLRELLRYSRAHRGQRWLAVTMSLLNKICDIAPELLIGAAVDIVVKSDGQSFMGRVLGTDDRFTQLSVLVAVTVVIWLAESATEYAAVITWRNLAQTIEHEARMDTYRHVQTLEMAYFEDKTSGGLMAVLNDDINQLERFLDLGPHKLIITAANVVFVGITFVVVSPLLAVLAFLPIPVIIAGSLWYQTRLEPRYAAVRASAGVIGDTLTNGLGGIATIKAFNAEDREVQRVEVDSEAYRQANRDAIRYSTAFNPLIRMAVLAGFTMTLIVGGRAALHGDLEIGVFSMLVYMTQRLLWPLTALGETLDLYQRAMASTHRVLDLLEIPIHVESGDQPLPKPVKGDVRFENVSFAYKNGIPVLKDVDLHAPAGQTIALVGATGSGKSSIVKLLLRFYEPQSGRITVDGLPIHEARLEELRGAIGLVSQDVFLFHGTVRENIAYGTFTATDDEIVTAAKAAEAHEFVLELPDGYDTIVGERGQKLSGGQRQRISIARAVLKNPPILVLDEATSAVDNETEAAIQRSLARISRGRTAVVIAHRLSTIRHAYRTYVLDRGRVVETGTHDDLVEKDGVYAALWKVQTGEAEIQV